MTTVDDLIDRSLETLVVPSFTSIGYSARRRLFDWKPLESFDMTGKVVAITGATSGLGLSAAQMMASLGAAIIVVGRGEDKTERARSEIVAATGNTAVSIALADLGDLDQVRSAAESIARQHDRLDVLIHNAGALFPKRKTTADGMELTVKVQVVAPFLLTSLLLPTLSASGGRVLTMSSGGMYTAGLTVDGLEMPPATYSGTKQYARAKRAQVTLNEIWAQRHGDKGVLFHTLHPGWADTPGVEAALPMFGKVLGPLLRSPQQGADTLIWLAAADKDDVLPNGSFWHDRQVRPIHRLGSTRRTDTPERRDRLWEWTVVAADVDE